MSLSIAALLTGCGNDSRKESKGGSRDQAPRLLAAPVLPSCGTGQFAKPKTQKLITAGKARGWQVVYVYPLGAPAPRHGETTAVTIVEYPPSDAPLKAKGASVIDVAGRQVSLYQRAKTAYVATWQTDRARYVALADGKTPVVLKKIISCSP